MTTVFDVRQGLADAITDGTGLRASHYVPEQMVAPIAVVARRSFDPRFVFSQSKATYELTVSIYVDRTNDRAAQETLDGFCEVSGVGSVIAAIQNSANWLNVSVDYAQVVNVSEVQAVGIAESQYFVVQLDVEVVF